MKITNLQAIIFALIILTACSKAQIEYRYPEDPKNQRNLRAGKFFSDDVILYGKKEDKNKQKSPKDSENSSSNNSNKDSNFAQIDKQITANKPLFYGAKEVVMDILGIDIADVDLGIVSSKWQENVSKKERSRVTILIKNFEIKEDNLNIAIHKEYMDENGSWIEKKSENEELLIKLLKEKIISKANNLQK